MKQKCPDAIISVEQLVSFEEYVAGGFGTSDCIILGDGHMYVIDYKHGKGVEVSAEDNPKLKCYALGSYLSFSSLHDIIDITLVPNQYADAVRLIFALFLQGKTVEEIVRTLTDLGLKTRKGNPLSRNNILYILKNETYKGDKLLQKQPPKNFISKKPDPTIPFESNYLENDHEPIVSRDVWDAVQAKLEENKKIGEVVGHRGGQPHF